MTREMAEFFEQILGGFAEEEIDFYGGSLGWKLDGEWDPTVLFHRAACSALAEYPEKRTA